MFLNHPQIKTVSDFNSLLKTEFAQENNAICWQRALPTGFDEIVSKLTLKEEITEISIEDLLSLKLSDEALDAREMMISDFTVLTNAGASPSLNLIRHYERDKEFDFISTDVYSYHVDRSPIKTDTYLCTYYGASSDILVNSDAIQLIKIPEVREKLRDLYIGSDYGFQEFLQENCFDLHYKPIKNANPINLGNGHLWKIAIDYPEQHVSPCIHRAPLEKDDELRLLLIC